MLVNSTLPDYAPEGSVTLDGLRIRYLSRGKGQPLVLVHGLLGYSFSWRFSLPVLSDQRRVIALDMPGSGFSDCDATLDCRLEPAAKRLLRFLDALGIDSCDLMGSSYGGTTALMAATLSPGHFRSLILVSPANPWSRIGRKRLALLRIPLVARAFPVIARKLRFLTSWGVRRMYGDPRRATSETLRGYSLPLGRNGVLEHAVKIAGSWRSDMRNLEAAMPRASAVPALIIWGTRDRLVEVESVMRVAGNFQTVDTVLIEGLGHLPYEEGPQEFCRTVLKFLNRHSPVLDGK